MKKYRIRKEDKVMIIAGKDKGNRASNAAATDYKDARLAEPSLFLFGKDAVIAGEQLFV